ncbi:glycoside hydrolase family 5 protein [uncultured Roseibium sp.]|uniref:glycoside hydrolase family 5 protein n=1 Tax=uncultured Roseibium sp. TaxID=1936171 RepID=UPI0026377D46|nr:glycoside hydrolase family 5 protein [uncultured Roseibium sp.]
MILVFPYCPSEKRHARFFAAVIAALAAIIIMSSMLQAEEIGCLRGVNVSGGEYGDAEGIYETAYIYPSDGTLDWAVSRHMNAIRLPFLWERLQPYLFTDLDAAELARLQDTVKRANIRGLSVVLDPHNYASFRGQKIGAGEVPAKALADFWGRLAHHFAGNNEVVFGVMNEPADIPSKVWFDAAQEALAAIRQANAENLVLIPGNMWTGASHWFDEQEGGSNAQLFEQISDPADNLAFEFHQYMDSDFSGTKNNCSRVDDAILALKKVTEWLDRNSFRGFLGEFGASTSPECLTGLMTVADYVNRHHTIWIGWTAWAAGEWWGDYPLSLQPVGKIDKPQMRALLPYLLPKGNSSQCAR